MAFSYVVPSRFGTLILLWQDTPEGPKVSRVLLPRDGHATDEISRVLQEGGSARSHPVVKALATRIGRFLEGEDIAFSLDLLAFETCSAFQQRVLRAEHAIPRGCVSTYGRIAAHLGSPGGARAVGNALAGNPFAVLIPCHRAIRSDMMLGGYQGGVSMKRALLEMEGLEISLNGRVVADSVFYSRGQESRL